MLQPIKRILCLSVLWVGAQSSFAFSVGGPLNAEAAWQVQAIGYALPGDVATPRNLGEEYRRTVPVIFYAFDSNFRDYFGSNGVYAIEQAVAVFNSLTNVSGFSTNLSEFPFQAQRENYRAEALFLTDLKSVMMHVLCEQMGLVEPERYVWTLHDREGPLAGLTCPAGMVYSVVQRNFDPVPSALDQFQSSSYVNGVLYSYFIEEFCGPPFPPTAITIPFQVDPLAFGFSSIAGFGDISKFTFGSFGGLLTGLGPGSFYTGLTRDDVGGLRYLLRSGNVNLEGAGTNTVTFVTNNAPQLLFTSNLTELASLALTNDPVTLQGLVPGLQVANSSNYFVTVWVTNLTAFFTNYPWDPVGTFPHLVFSTNRSLTIQSRFHHTFANVMGINSTTNGMSTTPIFDLDSTVGHAFVSIQTQTASNAPWAPPSSGILSFSTSTRTFITNEPVGEYFILPGTNCDMAILATVLTNLVTSTNLIALATNSIVSTNGVTNFQGFAQFELDYSTNHAFVVNPVVCPLNAVTWRGGVENVKFVRVPDNNFDELTYSLYTPITNDYNVNAFDPTNNVVYQQRNRRTAVFPDLIITAADLSSPPGDNLFGTGIYARNLNFVSSTTYGVAYQNLGGPGTIEPTTFVTFPKEGPIFEQDSFLGAFDPATAELNQIPELIWGSFDGSTNLPVVYPNGTSIANLENQLMIHVRPTGLPIGSVGTAFPTTTLIASGGQAPYTFALKPGSPSLPPGLSLSSTGTISGVPAQSGIFDFSIRVTDANSVIVDFLYAITINP